MLFRSLTFVGKNIWTAVKSDHPETAERVEHEAAARVDQARQHVAEASRALAEELDEPKPATDEQPAPTPTAATDEPTPTEPDADQATANNTREDRVNNRLYKLAADEPEPETTDAQVAAAADVTADERARQRRQRDILQRQMNIVDDLYEDVD